MLKIGDKIKSLRKAQNITQEMLSMIDSSSGIIWMLTSNKLMGKCENGNTEKTMENLLLAEKTATNYDSCTDLTEQKYKSLLANSCTFNPKTVGRNWEGTETGMLLNTLQKRVFDSIRETDSFKQLIVRLNNIQ